MLPGALAALAALLLGCSTPAAALADPRESPSPRAIGASGDLAPGLEPFETMVEDVMRRFSVPGGALAIVKGGRLIAARGYGLADREAGTPVEPTSSFALASLSKPITAAAILKLVENGKLELDEPAFPLLGVKQGGGAGAADPQLLRITVRELLSHSSGLPRDPAAVDCPPPGVPPLLAPTIACVMTKPLAYPPGTRSDYSNLGFEVLGDIIRVRSGAPDYGEAVRRLVLSPVGIDGARLEARRPSYLPGQVIGYAPGASGERLPGGGPPNRAPAGGWVTSAVEMARFLSAIDGTHGKPLLSRAMTDEMLARPEAPLVRRNGAWFGLGWDVVVPSSEGVSYSKNGGLPGTSTIMGHGAPDLDWVVFLNTGPGRDLPGGGPRAALGEAMRAQVARTTSWPSADYWSHYPPDGGAPSTAAPH